VVGTLLLETCLTAKQLPLVLTERQLDATASLSERVRTDAQASLARRVGASVAQAHTGPFPLSTQFLSDCSLVGKEGEGRNTR
jgi:hypothetical protein